MAEIRSIPAPNSAPVDELTTELTIVRRRIWELEVRAAYLQRKRGEPVYDDGLRCPRCGENNLHHGTVRVFTRLREDADSLRTDIGSDGRVTQTAAKDNPSARRDAIGIDFLCEHCENDAPNLRLNILQHKGTTYVEWSWKDAP